MEFYTKPSMKKPILYTCAILYMVCFGILEIASGKRNLYINIAIGICDAVMIISAIAQWITYFKKYIDFEIERKLQEYKSASDIKETIKRN
jgi:hypothetical protein